MVGREGDVNKSSEARKMVCSRQSKAGPTRRLVLKIDEILDRKMNKHELGRQNFSPLQMFPKNGNEQPRWHS